MANGEMDMWVKEIYHWALTRHAKFGKEERFNLMARCYYILMGDEVNRRIQADEPKIDLKLKGLCKSLLPWGKQ